MENLLSKRSWLERLAYRFSSEPRDREQLIELLREAKQHQVIDADALSMIEGSLQVEALQARDIMIPYAQMTIIEKTASLETILPIVIETNHSRYPVIDEDEIIGVLLAKDLLGFMLGNQEAFELRQILRPAHFVPESKRLNILLREFRATKNHMAIVVDEYGKAAGLVTMEDVLEQIIGEIEDETDIDEESYLKKHADGHFIIKAMMPMDAFNAYFSEPIDAQGCDTIAGVLAKHFGHLPMPHETIRIGSYAFTVVHADNRQIRVISLIVS